MEIYVQCCRSRPALEGWKVGELAGRLQPGLCWTYSEKKIGPGNYSIFIISTLSTYFYGLQLVSYDSLE